MKINPVAYGKNDNVHLTARSQGRVFKMVGFFNTGEVWILNNIIKKEPRNFNQEVLFKELSESIEELDFKLMTPRKKFLKVNLRTTTKLFNYFKDINHV